METTALPVPEAVRPRTVVVASVLATGAAAMAFLGLIAIYITRRAAATASGEEWFSEGAIELGPAGMMMMTLLLSSVTVQWAVQAVGDDDRPHGLMALGLTLLFGVAVLNQFWFLYQDTGFTIDGKVMRDYKILGMPTTVFINSKGETFRHWGGVLNNDVLTRVTDEMLEAETSALNN